MASKSVAKKSGQVQALVLVEIKKEPRVDSRACAFSLGIEHRALTQMVRNNQADFEEFGVLTSEMEKPHGKGSRGGRPEAFFWLNEGQSLLSVAYSKPTEESKMLKKKLVRLFLAYRKAAEKRASIEWQASRHELKLVRRVETDHIKVFVDYAIGQGSKSAKLYYANLTSMTYKALGFLELGLGENLREKLNIVQHQHLMAAESIVAFALQEGMEQGLHYKAIYQVAKERVVAFAKAMPPATFFDRLNVVALRPSPTPSLPLPPADAQLGLWGADE